MVKRISILLVLLANFLVSCKKNNFEISLIKPLNEFSEIEINNNFDVFLVEDTVYSIEIKGFEKYVDKVSFEVSNKKLILDNLQKNKFTHPKTNKVIVYIHFKNLEKLSANETCNVVTINTIHSPSFQYIAKSKANFANLEVNCTDFAFWNNFPCGGKIQLRGKTKLLKIWNTAIMTLDAKELETSYAYIENSSKGNCILTVKDKIEYKLQGDGNIEIYGKPMEIKELTKSGKGELIVH